MSLAQTTGLHQSHKLTRKQADTAQAPTLPAPYPGVGRIHCDSGGLASTSPVQSWCDLVTIICRERLYLRALAAVTDIRRGGTSIKHINKPASGSQKLRGLEWDPRPLSHHLCLTMHCLLSEGNALSSTGETQESSPSAQPPEECTIGGGHR